MRETETGTRIKFLAGKADDEAVLEQGGKVQDTNSYLM